MFLFPRHGARPAELREQAAAQEEAEVADCLHKPPDLRAGEALPVPEVPLARGQGRDSGATGPL